MRLGIALTVIFHEPAHNNRCGCLHEKVAEAHGIERRRRKEEIFGQLLRTRACCVCLLLRSSHVCPSFGL